MQDADLSPTEAQKRDDRELTVDALADEIVKMATRHGARRVVVYGNVEM